MKRTVWCAMLLGTMLLTAGCGGSESEKVPGPPESLIPAEAAAPAAPAAPAAGVAVEDDAGVEEESGSVAGALGKALWKGAAGGSDSDRPAEAPRFQP